MQLDKCPGQKKCYNFQFNLGTQAADRLNPAALKGFSFFCSLWAYL